MSQNWDNELKSEPIDMRDSPLLAEELGLLIDAATNYAIYMTDPNGIVTIWNRGAERIKGWSSADIIGQHFSLFYPPEDIAAAKPQADLDRAAAEGRVEEESWRIRKDGSEFLASITMTALRDADGALRGFGKVVRDITDQRASETALTRRELHLRSILETVPDAMVVIDERGRITSFSAAAERLFGHAQADVIGRNVKMLMPNPDRRQHDGYLENYRSTGKRKVIGKLRVVRGIRQDGETFPLELSVGETLSGGQRIFTAFLRDLTERQATELKMQDLQSELIHVSRLSAMGTMASTLAHELNQPLTAIANYLETTRDMLADSSPKTIERVRGALDEAAGQALRAGDIVRRSREFVAHGVVLQSVEPLGPLVREAAALGLIGSGQPDIDTVVELPDEEDWVLVDRVQIQQVLVNLIRNAVQAMVGSGEQRLTIATSHDANGLVEVSVQDSGSGVNPAVTDRLFQAFATTKKDGMGLGLSISRTIIEAHGGRIWMTPVPDGGSVFHFTLLRAPEATYVR